MEHAKRHFAISELAKEFDVSKRHIRFCEEKGLISPRITKLNRRIYSSYDRARLKLIFHCVLIGYSQDHIVKLIGMNDADLDEVDQIKKGLVYAERMIEGLEMLRNELSFHQRTSVINEIKMLGEYIKEIKAIPLEISEKSATKPMMPDKESKDTTHKPVEEIKPEVEQRPVRQPVRMAPLYIVGLAIVLIIGGFFYYQSSKKESEQIYLVQKEQAKTETQSVYSDRMPIDNTGDQKDLNLSSSESAVAEKAAAEKVAAERAAAEKVAAEKAAAEKAVAEKVAAEKAAAEKIAAEKVAAEKAAVEKAAAKKAAVEKAAAEKAAAEKIAAEKVAVERAAAEKAAVEKAAAEKAAAEKAAVEKAAAEKAAAEKAAAEKAAAEKAAAEKIAAEKVAAEKAVAEKQEAAVVKINENAQPQTVPKVVPDLPNILPDSEKQESVSLTNLQASESEVKEGSEIEESDIKEPVVTAETDTSLPQELKTEEKIPSQQDRKERLESFLNIYCQTYASKDLDKFATFFTSDATENNTPFQDMLPKYRKNMEKIESFNYRIELVDYSLLPDTGNISIQGKYFTRFLLHEGTWQENSGSISMELTDNDDSYLVKRLNYGK